MRLARTPQEVLERIQVGGEVVGQGSVEVHPNRVDLQPVGPCQPIGVGDLLADHVAANGLLRQQHDEVVGRLELTGNFLGPPLARQNALVHEDIEAFAPEERIERVREALIRLDVAIADEDVGHPAASWMIAEELPSAPSHPRMALITSRDAETCLRQPVARPWWW
jgi:hypothetical protein